MAHANIEQRRIHVKSLLESRTAFTANLKKQLSTKYNCSRAAINADIVTFTKPITAHSIHTSASMRKIVFDRDGNVCQYCGSESAFSYIVEHIIPAAIGGEARTYNLVVACQSCNTRKRRKVWIPRNLIEITENNLNWRKRVLLLMDTFSPNLYIKSL